MHQHAPTDGDDDKAAADLHDGQGDAEEAEDVRADEVGAEHEKETVDGDVPGEFAASFTGVVASECEVDRATTKRVDDREEGA